MNWYQEAADEEDEDLMFSPALLARRASESWIIAPPVEVLYDSHSISSNKYLTALTICTLISSAFVEQIHPSQHFIKFINFNHGNTNLNVTFIILSLRNATPLECSNRHALVAQEVNATRTGSVACR